MTNPLAPATSMKVIYRSNFSLNVSLNVRSTLCILTDVSRPAVLDRPFFCRVEPKVFDEFFGVARSRFDREACRSVVLSWPVHLQVGSSRW